MIYLILGSSGFLGTHLSSYLHSQGHTVSYFDIENNYREDLRISNNKILMKLIQTSDFIFFLAFDVGSASYLKANDENYNYIENNVKILTNTFAQLKSSKKPFIFISSQMSNMSYMTYGLLKKIGEKYTKSINGIFVRLWNIYGNENYSSKSHVITDFVYNAKSKGLINIKTTGKEKRQFLHVYDCCECLYIISKNYEKIDRNEIIDVTSFEWINIYQVASKINQILKTIEITTTNIKADFDYESEPSSYILKFWSPCIGLDDGLSSLLKQ